MKILLINAPVTVRNPHAHLSPPLGLAYIASSLRAEGHRVSAIDLNVSGLNHARIAGIIQRERPDIVGISAMTETITNGIAVAQTVKELAPDTVVVMGGAHPTILPFEVLAEDAVDFVVVGDGERTMVELVSYLGGDGPDLADIAGLGYKAPEAHVNERRALLHPDSLLLPARELFPTEFYAEPYNVLIATGSCPYRCPFCSAAAIWEGRRNVRSLESVVQELRSLQRDYGVEYVFFSDDIFTLDKKWVYDLLEQMKTLDFPMRWGCATRADLVDPELLRAMAVGGCQGIQYGVESGSQQILDTVKHIKKEQVLDAVNAAVAEGIEIACSFMVPFPDDTTETIAETGKFMRELADAHADLILNYTCPFPGTYFWDHAEELGLTILPKTWSEYDAKHVVMETRNLSKAQIQSAVEKIVRNLGLRKTTE
ncbi:MAG: B12-binding domain-containing radical SAM protein [Coriobacteriia bacterium]